MASAPENQSAHVHSVEKALLVLDTLSNGNRDMSLTEIAAALSWPKSTVHGLLSTLRAHQFVDQARDTGRYRLGVRLFELGSQVARGWNIRDLVRPVMRRLNETFGEMVQFAKEEDGEVLYIDKMESSQMLRIVSEIGTRLPMHCSGLGKALLAFRTPEAVRYILKTRGMRAMTARTIITPGALEAELANIRRQGYAIDDREIMEGLRCVAAPIFDRDGNVEYAISVSGFVNSIQGERFEQILAAVVKAAADISYAMGYRAEERLPGDAQKA